MKINSTHPVQIDGQTLIDKQINRQDLFNERCKLQRLYDMIYLTAIGLTPGGISTVHIYTQNNTQNNTIDTNYTQNNTIQEQCGPCPVFVRYTLAFDLQLRKKQGKTSVRVAGECRLANESIMCIMHWQNGTDREKPKYREKHLSQYHLVYRQSEEMSQTDVSLFGIRNQHFSS